MSKVAGLDLGKEPLDLFCDIDGRLPSSVFHTGLDEFQGASAVVCADKGRIRVWTDSAQQPVARSVRLQGVLTARHSFQTRRLMTVSSAGWLEMHPLFRQVPEHSLLPSGEKSKAFIVIDAARFSADGSRLVTLEWVASGESIERRIAVRDSPRWELSWHGSIPEDESADGFVMTDSADHVATFPIGMRSITVWDTRDPQHPPRILPTLTPRAESTFGVGFAEGESQIWVGRMTKQFRAPLLRPEWSFSIERHAVEGGEDHGSSAVLPKPGALLGMMPSGLTNDGRYVIYMPEDYIDGNQNSNVKSVVLQDSRTGEVYPPLWPEGGLGALLVISLMSSPGGMKAQADGPQTTTLTQGQESKGVWTRFTSAPQHLEVKAVRPEAEVPFVMSPRPAFGLSAYCASGPWLAHVKQYFKKLEVASSGEPMSVVRIESLATGKELVAFEHPPVSALQFSADCSRLLTLSADGVVREWFVSHPYPRKPGWVAHLGALVSGSRGEGARGEPTRELSSGPGREDFLRSLEDEARRGDAGARYVLDHIESITAR